MKVMIFAPHQDDEILAACGLIQMCRSHGHDVFIVFATNGDYHGAEIARQRYNESREALSQLGIENTNIYYLGYGDTGMHPSHSFLYRLLLLPMDEVLISPISSFTYHPAGMKTVRSLRTGKEGALTKRAFITDIEWCIKTHVPNVLVLPSPFDAHGDHSALALLANISYACNSIPLRLSYLIHGGDDANWPPRATESIVRPQILSTRIWEQRIVLPLTLEQYSLKRRLIEMFHSQQSEDKNGFLYSFARHEELFFFSDNQPTKYISPFFM